ncbi:MAG: RNA-binding S4 domain-containing protein [Erysipelotrichaceae bacterium]|jgi:ribosomal 50S subunit-recycling heat shock protein|nr:RNA-binding S4 domain-containing protein [Erysipelotrichaceae bacterium]
MRLDKYLKSARILKRRTTGKQLALFGRVLINERAAKPSTEVKVGDILVITYGPRRTTVRVKSVDPKIKPADGDTMFEVLKEERIQNPEEPQ